MVKSGHSFVEVNAAKSHLLFSYKSGALPAKLTLSTPEAEAWYNSCKKATFDFVKLFGNHDGHLRWGGIEPDKDDLKAGARKWTLNETRLLVELQAYNGEWRWDGIDLNSRFKVGDAGEILALTHFDFEDDGMILATGTPVSQPC
jgi:hypothetical protein